jgi:glycosyl transferase family 25
LLPIFIINLDSDRKRLQLITKQMDKLSLPFQRFSAIRGNDLPASIAHFFKNDDGSIASQLSSGEIGCYASHLTLMRQVSESGQTALILEDDVVIEPTFPALLDELLALDEPWDILRLTVSPRNNSPWLRLRGLSNGYSLARYFRVPPRTGAYLIRPEGARKFLEWQRPRWRPVDQDLRRVWDHGLKTLHVVPVPVMQNLGESTIRTLGGRIRSRAKYSRDNRRADQLRRALYNLRTVGLWGMLAGYTRLQS